MPVAASPLELSSPAELEAEADGAAVPLDPLDIDLDDLLGREPVPPHPELIDRCITDKVVMVTGAGGSIGAITGRQAARVVGSSA